MLKIILTIGGIQALAILVNMIRSKIAAVMLGPEGVGVVSTIDQVVQTAAFISAFSLPYAAIKFLSKAHSEGDEAFKRAYASFLKALFLLAGAGTLVTTSLVVFRAELLGSDVSPYKPFLLLGLLGIPAVVLGGFFSNVLAAAQNFKASSLLAVISNAALLIAITVGIFAAGIMGYYTGSALAGVLVIVGALFYLRKALGLPLYERTASITEELKRSPEIISFAIMIYLASFSYSVSLLVARYSVFTNLGEAQAGLLQGAIALSLPLGMVLTPVNGLYLTPIMNRNIEKDEKIRKAAEFQRMIIVILSAASMPLVLFPKLILAVLFSSKFTAASSLVFLFIIAQCISQLAGIYQALLIGFDDLKVYTAITCGGHLTLALLSWGMVARIGIAGVALGYIVSGLVIFLLTLARLKMRHGFSSHGNSLTAYTLLSLMAAGFMATRYVELNALVVLLKICLYALFMGSLLLFFSKEERSSLYGLRYKILPRKCVA